ncbi:hypothetical protein V8F20_011995 [Naviculisporaceae sp. PSN 640]
MRQVLAPDPARILSGCIAETNLPGPGSKELAYLVQKCALNPELKDRYILRPVRSGKGAGIVLVKISWLKSGRRPWSAYTPDPAARCRNWERV